MSKGKTARVQKCSGEVWREKRTSSSRALCQATTREGLSHLQHSEQLQALAALPRSSHAPKSDSLTSDTHREAARRHMMSQFTS